MKCIKRRQKQLCAKKHGLCQEIRHLYSPNENHKILQGLTVFYEGSVKYFWYIAGG